MIEAPHHPNRSRIRIGAILWLCCLQLLVLERFSGLRYYPTYSYNYQMISDLGITACSLNLRPVICSQRHIIMNLSFMMEALLMIAGSLLIRRHFNERAGFNVATGAIILSAVGLFWMGAAPADVAPQMHNIVVNIYLLSGASAMLIYGVMLFVMPGEIPFLGLVSVLSGLVSFVAALLTVTGGNGRSFKSNIPPGFIERLAAYGITLWMVLVAIVVIARKCRKAPPIPPIYLPPPPPPRMKEAV